MTHLNLKLLSQWKGTRPHPNGEQDCWDLRIKWSKRTFRTPFYCRGEPTLAAVMQCLRDDVAVARLPYDQWAERAGVIGSEAELYYLHCEQQTKRLREFLGPEFEHVFICIVQNAS